MEQDELAQVGWRDFSRSGPARALLPSVSLDSTLRAQPKAVIIMMIAVVLIILITFLDRLTGVEISLGVFYAVPIFLMAWYVDLTWGLGTAVLCMLSWGWANSGGPPFILKGTFVWSVISRLVYFVCIAVGTGALRKQRETDLARIAALERARALERDIVHVSEHEQRRIGQDLHDGLCQVLAGIGCAASMLKDELRAKSMPEAEAAEEIEGFIRDAATEARDLARGIFPVLQDAVGLESALEELAALTSKLHHRRIVVSHDDGLVFARPEVAMHVYRIAQEALANSLKHGKAENVNISLSKNNGCVRLTVEDDGRGMPLPPSTGSGMGLRTMRYRAGLIGARLEIEPSQKGGTLVKCEICGDSVVETKGG